MGWLLYYVDGRMMVACILAFFVTMIALNRKDLSYRILTAGIFLYASIETIGMIFSSGEEFWSKEVFPIVIPIVVLSGLPVFGVLIGQKKNSVASHIAFMFFGGIYQSVLLLVIIARSSSLAVWGLLLWLLMGLYIVLTVRKWIKRERDYA